MGKLFKGLVLFGLGAAAGYLAASKIKMSLNIENKENCSDCCHDDWDDEEKWEDDGFSSHSEGQSAPPIVKENDAPSDSEDLKFQG